MAARKRTFMEVHEGLDVDRTAEGDAPAGRGRWLYDDTLGAWVLSYDGLPYVPVEHIENAQAIPQPSQVTTGARNAATAPADFRGGLFWTERPIRFKRLSVQVDAVTAPATGRILIYQEPTGAMSNAVPLLAQFDFTPVAGRNEIWVDGAEDTTIVRGWFWLLWGQSSGAGSFDLDVYTTNTVSLANDFATLNTGDAPTQFDTAIAASGAPATIDPTVGADAASGSTDAAVVHRFFNIADPYEFILGGTPFELWDAALNVEVDPLTLRAAQWTGVYNGNVFVQATDSFQPSITAAWKNGKPALTGDGVEQRMVCAAYHATLSQPCFKWVVMQYTANPPGVSKPILSGLTNAQRLQPGTDPGVPPNWALSGGAASIVGADDDTNANALQCVFDATDEMFRNGTSVVSGSIGANDELGCRLMSNADESVFAPVHVAEYGIHASVPTAAQRTELLRYLQAKYGGLP